MRLLPIETAPKDETKILGFFVNDDGIKTAEVTYWGDTSGIYDPFWGRFNKSRWWRSTNAGNQWYDPTHWLPLDSFAISGPEGEQ